MERDVNTLHTIFRHAAITLVGTFLLMGLMAVVHAVYEPWPTTSFWTALLAVCLVRGIRYVIRCMVTSPDDCKEEK